MSNRETPFYLGGASSCVATTIVHPLDLIKVRLQTMKSSNGGARAGMVSTMAHIARNEGILCLYAGLSAGLLRQATYSTVRFGVYDKLKQYFSTESKQPKNVWQLLFCSSVAGALGGACGNPGDIINVRMQNDGQLLPNQRRNYKHAVDGLIRMCREEGISSLFRGLGPNINRAVLVTSSQCVSYDVFKDGILRYQLISEGLVLHFTSSMLAGLVATTVCSPVDVVKTRIMSLSERGLSSVAAMWHMYKFEGVGSFFRGWIPAFVRLGPQTIITFMVMEQLKKLYLAIQDRRSTIIVANNKLKP